MERPKPSEWVAEVKKLPTVEKVFLGSVVVAATIGPFVPVVGGAGITIGSVILGGKAVKTGYRALRRKE